MSRTQLSELTYKDFLEDMLHELGVPSSKIPDSKIIYALNQAIRVIADETECARHTFTFTGSANGSYIDPARIHGQAIRLNKGYVKQSDGTVLEFFDDDGATIDHFIAEAGDATEWYAKITLPEDAPSGEYTVEYIVMPDRFTMAPRDAVSWDGNSAAEETPIGLHSQTIWWPESFRYATVLCAVGRLWNSLGDRQAAFNAFRDYQYELKRVRAAWRTSSGKKTQRIVQHDLLR